MARFFVKPVWASLLSVAMLAAVLPDTTVAQRGRQQGQRRATPAPDRTLVPSEWSEKITWRSIGPANMGGRITALAVYEKDPSTWWAASASGGLIKTTNNGVTFEHQFDDQPTVSIGDVQVSQSDPNIVWVGTGESNPRNSVSWGDGVYKSTDGGKTWKNMGLNKSFQTGAIAIHPENPDVVYVGALGRLWGPNPERGLFKTTNGGKTWKKILFVDDLTGVVDIQLNPKNPDEMLVATYERKRDGFDGNDPVKRFGPGSAIYKSTDGGDSFTKVTKGLPTCNLGRIGLDYYRKNPKYVYAVIESEKIAQQPDDQPFAGLLGEDADAGVRLTRVTADGPADKGGLKVDDIVLSVDKEIVLSYDELLRRVRMKRAGDKIKLVVARNKKEVEVEMELGKVPSSGSRRSRSIFTGTLGGQAANLQDQQGPNGFEYGGVYMSSDGGTSWKRINSLNPRPMYYSHLRVDPQDRNNIYLCGTSLYRSFDGGKTFRGDGNSDGIHVDNHALWVDPQDPNHIILGCDGGVYVTYDQMKHWTHHNNVALGQFYHVGLDTRMNYNVYGGLQDNGSWGGPSRHDSGSIINSDWFRVGGGDGFITLVDPDDPDQIYYESQNGNTGSINLRTGARGFIRPRAPRGTRYRFNWKTPFILSPHNSEIYYSAGNHVFRSFNKGSGITSISPDITNTNRGAGSALSESPVQPGVLYVGTTDGAVWMTRDGGNEWTPLFSSKESKKEEAKDSKEEAKKDGDEPAAESARNRRGNRGRRSRDRRESAREPKEEAKKPEAKTEKPAEKKAAKKEDAKPESNKSDAKAEDLVSGKWSGKLISDRIPENRAGFEFTLKLDDNNKVTGEMASMRGNQTLELNGKFNPKTKEITFEAESRRGAREYSGTIKGDKMTGTLTAGGGRFEVDFEATRGGKLNLNFSAVIPANSLVAPAGLMGIIADFADDPISGDWVGTIESEEIPDGRVEFTLSVKMDSKNQLTGELSSSAGTLEIVEGYYVPNKKQITVVAENEEGLTVEIDGTVKGDKLTGTLDINGGMIELPVEATRKMTKPAADDEKQESPKSEEKKTQKEAPKAKQTAKEEKKAKAEPQAKTSEEAKAKSDEKQDEAAADDPVSGKWQGNLISPRGEQEVTMTLKRKADNKVTGTYESRMGTDEFTSGKFDPKTGMLTLVADNGRFELEYSGKVKSGAYAGNLDFNGGQFTMEFEMKRTESGSSDSDSEAATEESKTADESADAKPLAELLPGPRWVSSLEASRYSASRVYASFDGHRSDDDKPYAFVSNDYGKTWKSLTGRLPITAGSVRVIREDIANENLLYLGCEFSAWFSIDRGQTWTKFVGLPTVAVHEFAIHPTMGEIVAGTHGRSLWIADVSMLRQITPDAVRAKATLMKPKDVINWNRGRSRGDHGTHQFEGRNPSSGATLGFMLGQNARQVKLEVFNVEGELVRTFETENRKGLHMHQWDLRQQSADSGNTGRRRARGRQVPNGTYLVKLTVDGSTSQQTLQIRQDPNQPADRVAEDEELEAWMELGEDD